MPILPFGSAPTPRATASRYGTVTLSMIPAVVPVVMTSDLTLPANSQVLFRIPITIGSFRVVGGAGSYLVGV